MIRGYVIRKGNAKYKASELGVARNLMASKLEHTWQKLHHQPNVAMNNIQLPALPTLADKSARSVEYYTGYRPDTVSYTLTHSGQEQRFYIPEKVLECFNDEFDYRDIENSQELTDMAVALFIGLLETPNVATGGGGSQSDLPWRDKNEDDLQWARRRARAAIRTLGKKPKTGLKR